MDINWKILLESMPDNSFLIIKDGNSFCAVRNDFKDLQSSEAGFGDTPREALDDLLRLDVQ